jgi:hypothetical protein
LPPWKKLVLGDTTKMKVSFIFWLMLIGLFFELVLGAVKGRLLLVVTVALGEAPLPSVLAPVPNLLLHFVGPVENSPVYTSQ